MGYTVKIEDNQGNEKYFYSERARDHGQGSALAGRLVMHLTTTFPAYAPFSTRGNPRPGNPPSEAEDIVDAADVTTWP
jgi:hypothetical protein